MDALASLAVMHAKPAFDIPQLFLEPTPTPRPHHPGGAHLPGLFRSDSPFRHTTSNMNNLGSGAFCSRISIRSKGV